MESGLHARVDDISKRTILSRPRKLRPGVTSSVQKITLKKTLCQSSRLLLPLLLLQPGVHGDHARLKGWFLLGVDCRRSVKNSLFSFMRGASSLYAQWKPALILCLILTQTQAARVLLVQCASTLRTRFGAAKLRAFCFEMRNKRKCCSVVLCKLRPAEEYDL